MTDFERILEPYAQKNPASYAWMMPKEYSPEKKLMVYVEKQLSAGKHPTAPALLGVIRQHSAAAEACAQQVLSRVSKTKR